MMHIPTPGTITNVSGIPADLRAIAQWILWKPMVRGNKLTKTPVYWAEPFGDNVNAHDPKYWGTFDQVYAAMRADNAGRFGIGLVLDGTGIICIDYDDHVGDDAESVRNGAAFMAELSMLHPTYVERSLQGGGKHAFYRAVLPHGRTGGVIDVLNVEIYAAQFIAITGNQVIGSHPNVNDGQALVDSWNLPPPVSGAGTIEPTWALGRVINADDAQVYKTLAARRETTLRMMMSQADLDDRSTAFATIVGDLDKITGDPAQIDRIIRKYPFFKNAYNAEKYEQTPRWLAKYGCTSMLEYWLKQARKDNTQNIPIHIDVSEEQKAFMQQIVENTIAALKVAEKADTIKHAITKHDVAHDVRPNSPVAKLRYILEDEIGGEFDELSLPPGAVGDLVIALAPMLTGARLTYMLPAVIATLSGYLGQTFKLPGYELGLVNHFIIAGQMNTGKTSTMSVFDNAISLALSGYYRNSTTPTRLQRTPETEHMPLNRRMIDTRASSVQGLFDRLAHMGTATWFADEAESQIELMSSGQPLGIALKAFYKQTFDRSKALETTALDLSRATAAQGSPDIINMTLPTYWSCTSEVFQRLGEKELVDGTYSRVNMIYDEVPMSAEASDEIGLHKGLPYNLMRLVQRIAFIADDTAQAYNQPALSAKLRETLGGAKATATKEDYRKLLEICKRDGYAKCVVMDYTPEANDLRRKIAGICRQLGHDANPHIGHWPAHYQILARTDMLPLMIAGVLAACDALAKWDIVIPPENPDCRKTMPQVIVTRDHLQWAFEFVMHWRLRLFKAWDAGKIAVQMSDDEKQVSAAIAKVINTGNHGQVFEVEGTMWAAIGEVCKRAVQFEPFKSSNRISSVGRAASAMVRETIKRMVENGDLMVRQASDLGIDSKAQLVTIVKPV